MSEFVKIRIIGRCIYYNLLFEQFNFHRIILALWLSLRKRVFFYPLSVKWVVGKIELILTYYDWRALIRIYFCRDKEQALRRNCSGYLHARKTSLPRTTFSWCQQWQRKWWNRLCHRRRRYTKTVVVSKNWKWKSGEPPTILHSWFWSKSSAFKSEWSSRNGMKALARFFLS